MIAASDARREAAAAAAAARAIVVNPTALPKPAMRIRTAPRKPKHALGDVRFDEGATGDDVFTDAHGVQFAIRPDPEPSPTAASPTGDDDAAEDESPWRSHGGVPPPRAAQTGKTWAEHDLMAAIRRTDEQLRAAAANAPPGAFTPSRVDAHPDDEAFFEAT